MKVFPLVHTFWQETGMDLTLACFKLCCEPTPWAIYHKVEDYPVAHVVTFLDELTVQLPSLWNNLLGHLLWLYHGPSQKQRHMATATARW